MVLRDKSPEAGSDVRRKRMQRWEERGATNALIGFDRRCQLSRPTKIKARLSGTIYCIVCPSLGVSGAYVNGHRQYGKASASQTRAGSRTVALWGLDLGAPSRGGAVRLFAPPSFWRVQRPP